MRSIWILNAVVAMFGLSSIAAGQGLLDQVERGLENKAPAAATPAEDADNLPAPAEEPNSGYLGVGLENIVGGGILVTDIAADSPAEKAGLRVDDKVTAVNRAAVSDVDELGALMEGVPPGGRLTLTIDRAGKSLTLIATLAERSKQPAARAEADNPPRIDLGAPAPAETGDLPPPAGAAADPPTTPPAVGGDPAADADSGRASLGVTVITFDDLAKARSDVPARNGALITQIRPLSAADRAGLPVGAVIVAYEGQPIDTADDLVTAIAASRPGEQVEITYYRGGTVSRKEVTLVAAADSRLLAPGTGGLRDRPLLNRVERTLDGAARPSAGGADPAAGIPGIPSPAADLVLRDEIEALKAQVESLEKRLAEVEARLPAAQPLPGIEAAPAGDAAEPAPAADETGAAPASPPTLRPPPRRPPVNAPKLKIGDE